MAVSMKGVRELHRVRPATPLDESGDREWDAFVATIPGGLYPQSSGWAKVKMRAGWRTLHVMVDDGDQIVAGAQLLVRPLRALGGIGYVSKGPLLPAGDAELARVVLDGLLERAARSRVRYLVLQPPSRDEALERELVARGFEPSPDLGRPSTTLRIDVTRSADELLADMDKWTRRNIRRGQSHGVTVRMGRDADLDTFLNLRKVASQRKGFASIRHDSHYADMWRVLRARRQIELFVAEYQGEAVSAMLAIAFGDTVFAHASAWSGLHGSHKPNEVLQWSVLSWAKDHRYHYVDLEGIDLRIAEAIRDPLANPVDESSDVFVTRYKLGFGGQITTLSAAYDYLPRGPIRWAYHRIYPAVRQSRAARRVRNALLQRARR
jgi:lipid II:glycine glycyltransferase (peptidoglycan interpeptide bridge formation enzyme)